MLRYLQNAAQVRLQRLTVTNRPKMYSEHFFKILFFSDFSAGNGTIKTFKRLFKSIVRLTGPKMQTSPPDTKTIIMDVAEKLFAEKGIDATSTRAIVSEAGVNLAAINYHFGSKEGLLKAVIFRIVNKINDERLSQLDSLERNNQSPAINAIIIAFLSPFAKITQEQPNRSKYIIRLMGKLASDPERFWRITKEIFTEVVMRFSAAIKRALPHLSEIEVMWRFKFMLGAMIMVVAPRPLPDKLAKLEPAPDDVNQAIAYVIQFVSAGFQAPAVQDRPIPKN